MCNNIDHLDLHEGRMVSASHTQLKDLWHSNRNPISEPMFRASPLTLPRLAELFVLWLSADSSFKLGAFYRITVTRKQLAVRWELCPCAGGSD